jgi:hypothetical protein
MDFPQLSKKQYVANGALIAVGVAGIVFGALRHEYASPLHAFAYFLGIACVLCGAIALVVKRWHLAIVSMTVLAAIGGGLIGSAIWDSSRPGFYYRKGAEALGEQRAEYGIWGVSAAAPVVVLAAAIVAASRKRPA